jgi:hypothetical protein
MASTVVKSFQIEPPIPPAAIEHINEIGELPTSFADLIIWKYKLILAVITEFVCHMLISMWYLDIYPSRLFHSCSNFSDDCTGQSSGKSTVKFC